MKIALANLGANLVSLACIGTAAYLATNDKKGWGWFLLVGVICVCTVSYGRSGKE